MDYREFPLPRQLAGWVAAVWSLNCGGSRDDILHHSAPPDGCVELIRRTSGWSHWHGLQPDCFVAGIGLTPAPLSFSGDASFVGVRVWPWAWNYLSEPYCPRFANTWCAAPDVAANLIVADPHATIVRFLQHFADAPVPTTGAALLCADSVAQAAQSAGMSMRAVQRWSSRVIGLSPRSFLRLVRFGRAMQAIQHDPSTLALHAASGGFADQSHMVREFRDLGDDAPSAMRQKAMGPFVPRRTPQG